MTDLASQALADAKTLFNDLVADALPTVVPDVETFLNEIAGNPSAVEFTAALAQLQASLVAQGPSIAQKWTAQVNAMITARSTAFLASLNGGATGATGATGAAS